MSMYFQCLRVVFPIVTLSMMNVTFHHPPWLFVVSVVAWPLQCMWTCMIFSVGDCQGSSTWFYALLRHRGKHILLDFNVGFTTLSAFQSILACISVSFLYLNFSRVVSEARNFTLSSTSPVKFYSTASPVATLSTDINTISLTMTWLHCQRLYWHWLVPLKFLSKPLKWAGTPANKIQTRTWSQARPVTGAPPSTPGDPYVFPSRQWIRACSHNYSLW